MPFSIFDQVERSDLDPADHGDPPFEYLNRSARPEAANVRNLIESWTENFPSEHRAELRARLRSDHHLSAFFELAIHELMCRQNFDAEIHPEISGDVRRKPDFCFSREQTPYFFLEATTIEDCFEPDAGTRARLNDLLDALNRMNSPNFFLEVSINGQPRTPPSARKIREAISERLETLDPDEIAERFKDERYDLIPKWLFEHDGLTLEVSPIPKSPENRGRDDIRPVGMLIPEAKWLDSRTGLRDAIKGKGGRYGHLELPFVVAVNVSGFPLDWIAIMEALFGKEGFIFRADARDSEPEMQRKPDGVWTSPSGPIYTRVSAVLVTSNVTPWAIAGARMRLVHNPWAKNPVDEKWFSIPQSVAGSDNKMKKIEGIERKDLFQLPEGWPNT